jgi:hypothetical protein
VTIARAPGLHLRDERDAPVRRRHPLIRRGLVSALLTPKSLDAARCAEVAAARAAKQREARKPAVTD